MTAVAVGSLEVQVETVSLLTVRFSGGSAGTSAMIVVTSVRLSLWCLESRFIWKLLSSVSFAILKYVSA